MTDIDEMITWFFHETQPLSPYQHNAIKYILNLVAVAVRKGYNPYQYVDGAEFIGQQWANKPEPVVYEALYNMLMDYSEKHRRVSETHPWFATKVDKHEPYLMFSLVEIPFPTADAMFREIFPKFPYLKAEAEYDVNMFIDQLGSHKVSGGFNLGLQDYLAAVADPNTREQVRNMVIQYFTAVPGNNDLEFFDLYNYLLKLK
jgi:hypothetical protein